MGGVNRGETVNNIKRMNNPSVNILPGESQSPLSSV